MSVEHLERDIASGTAAVCLLRPEDYKLLLNIPFLLCLDHCFNREKSNEQTFIVVFSSQIVRYRFESCLREDYKDFDDFSENNKDLIVGCFSGLEFPQTFVSSLDSGLCQMTEKIASDDGLA